MKKFLGIIVIAGALTACNNSGESTTGADSTATDSTINSVQPATDSTKVDSTLAGDTTKKVADTSMKMK